MHSIDQKNFSDNQIDKAFEVTIITDEKGKISLWNSVAEILFAIKSERAIGKSIEEIFNIAQKPDLMIALAKSLKGQPYSCQELFFSEDGIGKSYQFHFRPLLNSLNIISGLFINAVPRVLPNGTKEVLSPLECSFPSGDPSLFNNVPGFFYICLNNEKWEAQYVSEGCFSITGYHKEDFISKKVHYGSLILKEHKENVWSQVQKNMKKRTSFQLEYQIRTASGEVKWVWEQGKPVFDRAGNLLVEGYITDITDRKNAEAELQKSEERFRVLFEKSPVAKGISRGGITLQVNPAYVSLFGFSDESELIGRPVLDQIAPIARPDIIEKIQKRLNGEFVESEYETIGLRKDGTEFPFKIDVAYFELPDGLATIVHIKDITKQKEAEKELQESLRRFKTLFESGLIGITINDRNGRVLDANRYFLDLLGYNIQELEDGLLNWKTLTPPDFTLLDEEVIREYDKTGIIKPFEKEYFRKDGSRIPVLVGASSFSEDSGITFVVDLSNLKQSRVQLEKINKELNTFLYMASHDLKGPLSTVKGLTEIARNESKEAVALKYIDLISQSIAKLDKSLMNLLKIMKIKGEGSEKDEIDFNVMVPEVVENLKNIEGFEKVEITFDVQLSEPFRGNPGIVNSVLQNLIENSIKYQSNAKGEPFVHIKIRDNSTSVLIEVEDNGRGIDPQIKNRVFDMFYRGTTESKGSGLGLYIVKNAVEKVGGKIDFAPRPGGGTIFKLTFQK